MKKGKRYKTKQEIEKQIDRLKTRAEFYFKEAEQSELKALRCARQGSTVLGEELLNLAFNRRRRAMNILEKKLPRLGEKLAEFLTPQLPALDNGDGSIPAF